MPNSNQVAEAKKEAWERVKDFPKFAEMSEAEFKKVFDEAVHDLRVRRVKQILDELL